MSNETDSQAGLIAKMVKKNAALDAALDVLCAMRRDVYENVRLDDGSVPDEVDREELAALDAVINQCQDAR